MIQLQILSGKQAGRDIVVRRFPFHIGRSSDAGLPLDDAGVWDRHVQLDFQPGTGFTCVTPTDALTLLNGARIEGGTLRNGDLLELGSARLRFWLARSEQRTLRVRELLTWAGLAAIFTAQAALICWLRR